MKKVRTHLTYDEFVKFASNPAVLIIDTRSLEDYSDGHIPGSYTMPLKANLEALCKTYLTPSSTVLFVSTPGTEIEVVQKFTQQGIERYLGHLHDGINGWKGDLYTTRFITAPQLYDINRKENIKIIDIRS